jgi:hypothetical protein
MKHCAPRARAGQRAMKMLAELVKIDPVGVCWI